METPETRRAQEERPELPTGHGELVLVADDDSSIRELTKEILETSGYQVITANNGIKALALYEKHRGEIAVVLTDMMMPFMDGPATIRALRKMDPQVKIIAMSEDASNTARDVAVTETQGILPKPYTVERLLKVLHEILSAK
jgi:CheY-like chemotaxis protein